MRFKDIFGGEAPIHSGVLPIWLVFTFLLLLHPEFGKLPPGAGIVVPFGMLVLIEDLYRLGEWLEFRVRNRTRPSAGGGSRPR